MALLLPALGLRMAGIDGSWIGLLQLPQTLSLILAAFLIGEIGLSPPSPGANDNGSGVAAALLAGDALAEQPPEQVEVRLLLCGAGQSTSEGARWFLREHRRQLDRSQTWFIDVSSAGIGRPRYVSREVPALAQALDPDLCGIAAALEEGSDQGLAELDPGPCGSASLFAGYGYPAIALTAREGNEFTPSHHHTPADRPETVDGNSIAAVAALTEDLVRLLDRSVTRERGSTGG
jgi:acetylornithine deacetylase/succinyl-diaminopimelate desuccinylase-like protein